LGRLDQAWNQNWVRLAGIVKGDWAAGDLGNESHWVIDTPTAIWIASEGELIRIDRKRVATVIDKSDAR
jgi:hypothetical protein